jgi:RNA polymerase sigma factor (sigma-70 family)
VSVRSLFNDGGARIARPGRAIRRLRTFKVAMSSHVNLVAPPTRRAARGLDCEACSGQDSRTASGLRVVALADDTDRNFSESTAVLLGRVQQGDPSARERLFVRFLPVLERWARGRLPGYARSSMETDDLVQVTLLRALQRIDEFDARREGAFLAYLRHILLNQVRDEIRVARRRPGHEPLDEHTACQASSVVTQVMGQEFLERYEAALGQLEERQAEAVILRIEFGYSLEQVAEAIDAPSANAARMVVSRALLRLAEILDEQS